MLSQILATSINMNSSIGSVSASSSIGTGAAFMSIFGASMFLVIAAGVASIVGMWKIFEKAGVEGWKSIIPFYNLYLLTEISGQEGLLFLLNLIPGVGSLIWSIMVSLKLAPAFGKDTAFAIGLILLGPIFYCILGFSDAQYKLGPVGSNKAKPSTSASQGQAPTA